MDVAREETLRSATSAVCRRIMEKEKDEDHSEIQEFFEGRSVFITGAGGYLGGVLLEHLLRTCPGIDEIFILLREKRGVTPEVRKEKILDKKIFCKVKEDNPKAIEKVHVVPGELTADDLGISPANIEKLKANVSVVFHCAASISFRKDFSFMVMNNVVGTENVINLCKKFPKIAAFVHTSTAYSNCYQQTIKEEVTRMPIPVERIVDAARTGDDDFLTAFQKNHGKKWPNAYVLTKSIAENVVANEAAVIPTAIVRPSIINVVWKGALPGYTETGTAFVDLIFGVALGYLQVLLMDRKKNVDSVPPDIVANTLIASAWAVATKRMDNPLVLNCVSSNTVRFTYSDLYFQLWEKRYNAISPYTFRFANATMVGNPILYQLLSFFYHHIPGYAGDLHARLSGGKARFVKGYKKFDQSMLDAGFITLNEFDFQSANFEGLKSILNEKDNEIFSIDLSGYSFSYMVQNTSVNRIFQFKNDDVALKCKQVEFVTRASLYTEFYKCFLLFILVLVAWHFVTLLLGILM